MFVAKRAFYCLIVVHLSNVSAQVAHCKLLFTMWARLLYPLVLLSHVPSHVVRTDFLLALFALRFLSNMNALDVTAQQLFPVESFITVRTFNFLAFVRTTHMCMKVIALFVTDIAC